MEIICHDLKGANRRAGAQATAGDAGLVRYEKCTRSHAAVTAKPVRTFSARRLRTVGSDLQILWSDADRRCCGGNPGCR